MKNIGFAVDLGTTTIDYCLLKLDDGSMISNASIKNPQCLYGSDVINRILTITRDATFADVLKDQIINSLTACFTKMLKDNDFEPEDVKRICICGNTTMISILLKLDVACLGVAPFKPKLHDSVVVPAKQLFGYESLFDCEVFLSGCAGAFIGGDILAGIYYLKNTFKDEAFYKNNCLFIDLGTNGEMILYANDKLYGVSTACGPAFESCTRRQRIYGSTTIEAISLCLSSHKLLPNGSFGQEGVEKLTINNVELNSDILQSILLAKAAIAAGISVLCEQAHVRLDDIATVYLAGGFGFYLNVTHAIHIGLLPGQFKDIIKVVGNTSLNGAKLLLQTDNTSALLMNTIEVLNLATIPSYQEKFIENMYFQPFS